MIYLALGANLGDQTPPSPVFSSRGEVAARSAQPEAQPSETRNSQPETGVSGYVSHSTDDYELGSEVVRHAQPVEDTRADATAYSREAESNYASLIKGTDAASDEPAAIDTVTSSVNINYDASDLEIPAFLRKRGDS